MHVTTKNDSHISSRGCLDTFNTAFACPYVSCVFKSSKRHRAEIFPLMTISISIYRLPEDVRVSTRPIYFSPLENSLEEYAQMTTCYRMTDEVLNQ